MSPAPDPQMGRALMALGAVLLAAGALWAYGGKLFPSGRFPGTIHIERDNFSFTFPVLACVIASVALTLVLNLFFRR